MSLWRDDTPPSRWALVPLVALGLLALGSLSRVFSSPAYLAWGLPATAAGAAFALAFGRRSLALGLGLLAAATLLTLPALFARELTRYLLPTPAAYRFVGTLFVSGLGGIMREAAPVPADPRYLIVLWTAALVGGFLGGAWVVVERPIGAVASALATVAFAGSVGKGGGRDAYGFGAVLLLGGFLLIDGRHRIATWSRPPHRVAPGAGVATLGLASLLALAGPAVLGATQPWLQLQSALRPRLVVIKPLADVRDQLRVYPPAEVMRVTATAPTYWRLAALDTYTGTEWLLEARPVAGRNGRLPKPDPPTSGPLVTQQYAITSLLSPWLPAAYAAERIDTPAPFELDPGTSTLLLAGKTLPGLRYSVTSRLPPDTPPPRAPAAPAKPDPAAATFGELARSIVGGAATPWEQATALERYFRRFSYDEAVPGGHTPQRLQQFLHDRRGYCEQFAATMTLMLRGLGIPARVAVGFLPGTTRDGRTFLVTTRDAHAWVEALMPGAGWVRFDPTPGRGQPTAGNGPQDQPPPSPPPPPGSLPTPQPGAQHGVQAGGTPEGARVPWPPLAALAAAAGSFPGAKALRRRLRRAGPPARSVLGAYAELVDLLADLGWRASPAQTPWEVWRQAWRDGRAPGAEAAAEVVRLAVLSLYGPRPLSTDQAQHAWRRLRPAVGALRGTLPRWRRVAAVFDPRTLLPSRSPAARLAEA